MIVIVEVEEIVRPGYRPGLEQVCESIKDAILDYDPRRISIKISAHIPFKPHQEF
jgi:hypothetical protein